MCFEVTMNFRGSGCGSVLNPNLPVDLGIAERDVVAADTIDDGLPDDERGDQALCKPLE